MSLLFAAALAASSATLPVCSWDTPGRNVFSGDVPSAVDRYTDIPAPVRATLKRRMAAYQYDDVAAIRRDSIEGRHHYTDLRDMHFGAAQVCRDVTREKWSADAEERGLVYCERGHCLIVPTVCRNVSRVTRIPSAAGIPPVAGAGAGGSGGSAEGGAPLAAAPTDELQFEPPSAGGARPTQPAQSFAGGASTGGPGAPAQVALASWPDWGNPTLTPGVGPSGGSFAGSAGAGGGPIGGGGGGAPRGRESNGVIVSDGMGNAPASGNPIFGDGSFAAPAVVPGATPPVPEPGTALLFVAGIALLVFVRRTSSR